MMRMIKIVEIGWIVVAVISAMEIIRLWGKGDRTFWMFTGAFVVAVLMFFFRRRQRLRMEERLRQRNDEQETGK